MELILNGASNGYDIQPVYNGNDFLGITVKLAQVSLVVYDTTIQPCTYTGSENVGITDNIKFLN